MPGGGRRDAVRSRRICRGGAWRSDLSRTTLCGWVADVAAALTPIAAQLRREVVAARYVQTDDTSVTVSRLSLKRVGQQRSIDGSRARAATESRYQ
jgi:hypothetical protein